MRRPSCDVESQAKRQKVHQTLMWGVSIPLNSSSMESISVLKQTAVSREVVMFLTKSCHTSKLLSSSHCQRDIGLLISLMLCGLKLVHP